MSKCYIHYGSESFDIKRFEKITNVESFTKPDGGFWASPLCAKYGWIDFINDNSDMNFVNTILKFKFYVDEKANIFHIFSTNDLYKLPGVMRKSGTYCIDFEKCVDAGYDAIELHLSEEKIIRKEENEFNKLSFTNRLRWKLSSWDCDSILILNPKIIIEV